MTAPVAPATDAGNVALEITQSALPHTPWADPALSRMPGMRPVTEGSWIIVDEVYGAQLAEKARLLAERRDHVLMAEPGSEAAQADCLETVLADLPPGFAREGRVVRRPDGFRVSLDGPPLEVASRLIQEDLLLLDRRGAEHVLIAGLLCFPAHWTLAEKIGRPLVRIHAPVPEYDADLARRVQRLFDRAVSGRPMWRANVLPHAEAVLHRPRAEAAAPERPETARYVRSERQTVLRLPRTGAVLFAVHTWIVPLDRLTPAQRAGCPVG
ncbi:DUF3445 domain-containing protein [uncultured Jannaschia sp.]|uniref:heme-dependent oxidative N-demethylase family protein n=1 Tax=uncultured Jannaschia sp. TaxID=293347 RepID=UPI002625D8E3|nr:DUF3445 domain-containing protein [uncultured Jannaschia sp.]